MYQRTQNETGTFTTRCLYCFMTVATGVETENALEQLEKRHLCPERLLAQSRERPKAPARKRDWGEIQVY